jgi:DnaJ domain
VPDRTSFDPYAVLGVTRTASALQVARAHRRLAKRFHPDLHPNQKEEVNERMRRINAAWRLLSNPLQREAWDRAHPTDPAGVGHWVATRRSIQPVQPTTTRTWASWRATAADTIAAPRTRRAPGEIPVPPTRRPVPITPTERTFRDTGWAAILVAAFILLLLMAAIAAGKLA